MGYRVTLEHPRHGRKEAYTEREAEADKANGWTVAKPVVAPAPVVAEPKDERADLMALLDAEGVKFDRRWSTDKLRALVPVD